MPLVSITRDELHHIVWLKPLQELSSMLGITGERLEELCVLLRMPYPRSHYWKRLRAGERVVKFQLPKPAPETPGSATLQLAHVSARELDALKNATLLDATAPELRTKTAPKIHPIIAAWHASFRGLQRQYKSDRAAFHWSACDLRKHKILDQIFTAVEKDGYVVEEGRAEKTSHCRDPISNCTLDSLKPG